MKGHERRRVRSQPNPAVAVQNAARNLVPGEGHVIQAGHAKVEDATVDHHQMIPATNERRVVAVEIAVLVREEATEATMNHPNQEAGAEIKGMNKGDTKS